MGFFEWFTLLVQIVPLIISLVRSAEMPGQGPLKRELVIALALDGLNAALQLAGKNPLSDSQKQFITFFIGSIIDSIVGFFNKTGQFVHASA